MYKKINKELKAEIIRSFGAQYPFAAALEIRESTVSAVIRGHQTLSNDEMKRWADVLKTDIKSIFGEGMNHGQAKD
jgi:plasmid maintenance system antidote protein VapI